MLNRYYGLVMCSAFLGALFAQVYIPIPDSHVFFVVNAVLAGFLVLDASYRRIRLSNTLGWMLAAMVLAPLVVPRWWANRPLLPGETRKGGVDSNFFTAFAIVTLIYTGTSAACSFLNFGAEHGFELIINSGFAVAGVAWVVGLATKKEEKFESGPAKAEK